MPITFKTGTLIVIATLGAITGAVGSVVTYVGIRLGTKFAEEFGGGPEIVIPEPPKEIKLPPPPHELFSNLVRRGE